MTMKQFKSKQHIMDRTATSINYYLRDVNRYPMANIEEEVSLAQAIHRGGKEAEHARARLVEANLRFVITVANLYQQKNIELADLISEGNIGLIKAAERFDETRGFKFISYAVWWIRQSIIRAIYEQDQTIRMPQDMTGLQRMYNLLLGETMQTEQRKPTAEEFVTFANIDINKAKLFIKNAIPTVSIDSPLSCDSDYNISDTIPSPLQSDSFIEQESLSKDVQRFLRLHLTAKENHIICRSFGIACCEESINDISQDFGLSCAQIRQIKLRALMKIKRSSHKKMLAQYFA